MKNERRIRGEGVPGSFPAMTDYGGLHPHSHCEIHPLTLTEHLFYYAPRQEVKQCGKLIKNTASGATTPSYENALDWKVEELREKTILLQNTHPSASPKYKLLVYASYNGIAGEEIPETVLEVGKTAKMQLLKPWERPVLQVTDGSGSAAYRVDCIGQGA